MMQKTEKERLVAVLDGKTVDRAPVICPGGMMSAATTEILRQMGECFHTDSAVMAETAIEVRKSTGFENFGVPFCVTVEAEALGSRVAIGSSSVEPRILEYGARSLAEAAALSAPDPQKDGRLPVVLDAISSLAPAGWRSARHWQHHRSGKPGDIHPGPLPFFQAPAQRCEGIARVPGICDGLPGRICARTDRSRSRCSVHSRPFGDGRDPGAKLFSRICRSVPYPPVDEIRKTGAAVILHICGDTSLLFEELNAIRGAAFSFDAMVSMKKARESIAASPIMGNVNTQLLHQSSPERVCRAVGHAMEHKVDIVAPACGLSMATPLENLRALTDMVKNVKNVHTRGCGRQSAS